MAGETRPLNGKHAIVTGGGRGIGLGVAAALARLGADVTITGRDAGALQPEADKLATDHKVRTAAQQLALSDPSGVQAAIDQAMDRLRPAAILVNNAGIAPRAKIQDTALETWQDTFAVNATGAFLCLQAVLPGMRDAGWGRIVTIASTAGLRGYPRVAAYVASKHAVIGLTRAAALELAKTGITVNAVCPGYTETEMAEGAIRNIMASGKTEAEARAVLANNNPQGRLVQVEEVADAVAWLCSPGASAVTGQAIAVAGGEVM